MDLLWSTCKAWAEERQRPLPSTREISVAYSLNPFVIKLRTLRLPIRDFRNSATVECLLPISANAVCVAKETTCDCGGHGSHDRRSRRDCADYP